MGAHLRLRTRIGLAVTAGALLVAGGLALLLANTLKLRSSAGATLRTTAYLSNVIEAERLIVDAETGLRGYVITRRPLFLAPLHAAQLAFPDAVTALEQSAARESAFIPESQSLIGASRSYLSSYVPSVLAMAVHDRAAARSFSVTLAGKTRVDGIRARAATLERLLSARQRQRQRDARASANYAVSEAIVALIVLTVLTFLLGVVLGRLAVERDRALERSQQTTHTLQQSLLPEHIPDIPGCELAVRFNPAGAGELVGGDFYDVFPVQDGSWAVVLGDVCGKGPAAAAVTAMARWTLRSLAATRVVPGDALRFLNEALLRHSRDGRFITVAYVLLSVEGHTARASIACAGHPPPILLPECGDPVPVSARGTLLGIWPEVSLRTAELELVPGDALVIYSDGVTDRGAGTGLPSPGEMLSGAGDNTTAAQLAGAVERFAHSLPGPQRDDIAILALRIGRAEAADEGPGGPSAGERELSPDPISVPPLGSPSERQLFDDAKPEAAERARLVLL